MAHQDDGPGDVPGGDLLPGHPVDLGEAPGVDFRAAGGGGGGSGSTMTGGKGRGAVAHPARPPRMSATSMTINAGKDLAEGIWGIDHYR